MCTLIGLKTCACTHILIPTNLCIEPQDKIPNGLRYIELTAEKITQISSSSRSPLLLVKIIKKLLL